MDEIRQFVHSLLREDEVIEDMVYATCILCEEVIKLHGPEIHNKKSAVTHFMIQHPVKMEERFGEVRNTTGRRYNVEFVMSLFKLLEVIEDTMFMRCLFCEEVFMLGGPKNPTRRTLVPHLIINHPEKIDEKFEELRNATKKVAEGNGAVAARPLPKFQLISLRNATKKVAEGNGAVVARPLPKFQLISLFKGL